MKINKISLIAAAEICSCAKFELYRFFETASPGQIFDFNHYNFYYSYPSFRRTWSNGLSTQFHRVETCCSECQDHPERNFAGVGSIHLCMLEDRKAALLCDEHSAGLPVYDAILCFTQLPLF